MGGLPGSIAEVWAVVGSLLFLSDSRADHAQKLDIGGVVLLSVTLGLLVYPLVEAEPN